MSEGGQCTLGAVGIAGGDDRAAGCDLASLRGRQIEGRVAAGSIGRIGKGGLWLYPRGIGR